MAGDPNDLSSMYNTALTPEQEAQYQEWAIKNGRTHDTYDYDMRGAWLEGVEQSKDNSHFPDTYKKPNHPTFSKESKYNGVDGFQGGDWVDQGEGKWAYQASPTNLHWKSPEQLQDYFQKVEPGNTLLLPNNEVKK